MSKDKCPTCGSEKEHLRFGYPEPNNKQYCADPWHDQPKEKLPESCKECSHYFDCHTKPVANAYGGLECNKIRTSQAPKQDDESVLLQFYEKHPPIKGTPNLHKSWDINDAFYTGVAHARKSDDRIKDAVTTIRCAEQHLRHYKDDRALEVLSAFLNEQEDK